MGLEYTSSKKIRLVETDGNCTPEFSNLEEFVKYFSKEALTFESENGIVYIILKPVLPKTRMFK